MAWARKHLRGARGDALAEDATAALEEAASQIDALADAEGKHAPVDGLSKPAFFGRLVLAVAFVLLVCFVTPRFTFGSWKNGVVNAGEPLATAATVLISPTGMGENSVYPDALWDISSVPTATFTGAALLGFLAAAATVLAPQVRQRRLRHPRRAHPRADAPARHRPAQGGGPHCGRRRRGRLLDHRQRGRARPGGPRHERVHREDPGAPAPRGHAYCGLAALSFAVIAVARREHPTMVTLTLLTIACVIPFLVLFAGTIGIFIVVLYFIFSLFRR